MPNAKMIILINEISQNLHKKPFIFRSDAELDGLYNAIALESDPELRTRAYNILLEYYYKQRVLLRIPRDAVVFMTSNGKSIIDSVTFDFAVQQSITNCQEHHAVALSDAKIEAFKFCDFDLRRLLAKHLLRKRAPSSQHYSTYEHAVNTFTAALTAKQTNNIFTHLPLIEQLLETNDTELSLQNDRIFLCKVFADMDGPYCAKISAKNHKGEKFYYIGELMKVACNYAKTGKNDPERIKKMQAFFQNNDNTLDEIIHLIKEKFYTAEAIQTLHGEVFAALSSKDDQADKFAGLPNILLDIDDDELIALFTMILKSQLAHQVFAPTFKKDFIDALHQRHSSVIGEVVKQANILLTTDRKKIDDYPSLRALKWMHNRAIAKENDRLLFVSKQKADAIVLFIRGEHSYFLTRLKDNGTADDQYAVFLIDDENMMKKIRATLDASEYANAVVAVVKDYGRPSVSSPRSSASTVSTESPKLKRKPALKTYTM